MLPQPIADDLASLLPQIERAGFTPAESLYAAAAFGNYTASFVGSRGHFDIVRERRQYYVAGVPRETLEPAGLWQAFDDRAAFESHLLRWLTQA